MLQNARRLKDEGVDIIVGLVETHGRAETSALVHGLEVLPRRNVEYHGRTIEEFDLDAALARKPKLIIVDELAHTNAPDSRHPKRWQDVQELLAAGIDVWTALNIQHLESLADVVSRITGVVVRETVPDRVLQEATDVVLVDLTPDELIQRLNEGKVYVPETARRATQSFFTPGNLTALRELALRRTAERVDDQMVDYLRQKAIEGPWAASERLLACVGPDEVSERVIRRASQLATGLNAPWTAVTVETIGQAADAKRANQLAKVFSLAERLGGDAMRLQGSDYTTELLRLARRENVTQIVLGQSRAGLLRRIFGRSLPEALMRDAGGIEIHVVPGEEAQPSLWRRLRPFFARKGLGVELAGALASVACAVAVGQALTSGSEASQFVDDLPDRGALYSRAFRHPRRGHRLARLLRRLQFLLHRAGLHVHGGAAAGIVRPANLSRRRGVRRIANRTHPRPTGDGDQKRRGDAVAL